MIISETEQLYEKGVAAVDAENWLAALVCFEKLVQLEGKPVYLSFYAACMAKERGQFNQAALLCRDALEKEPDNPVHYLNLGRIFMLQGRKDETIKILRDGLSHGAEPRIIEELQKLGTRKPPVFPFLGRNSLINKYCGILLKIIRFC
jgi:predicted Zn-dependent protease